jgi:hypothetical protein
MRIRPAVVQEHCRPQDVDVGLWHTRRNRTLPGLVLPVFWSDESTFMAQFLGHDLTISMAVLDRGMVRNTEVN